MELTLTKLIHQEPEKRNPHKTFLSALSIASPPQRTLLSLSVPSSRPAQQILRLLDLRHASSAPTHDWPPSWTSRTRMQLRFSSSTPSFLNLCPAVLLWMKRKPIKKINYEKKKKRPLFKKCLLIRSVFCTECNFKISGMITAVF